ncbi:hypothetical protein [Saccharothrix obliqua]|uniref:hypothetical protein n=1 Tax=Saccharothrix obliqua TaxID=2861747 RepID=UPI001C5ECE5A|nr:hypothetical protein [Saccharothrix obliqua]MBW4717242.1 hypothetical protein [Saccharothrix obliqua]
MADVTFGLSAETLNDIVRNVHKQLYPKHFRDSKKIERGGVKGELSWDAASPPVLVLKEEGNAIGHDAVDFPEGTLPEGVAQRILDVYQGRSFEVLLENVSLVLKLDNTATPQPVTAKITVVAVIDISGNRLAIKPLSAKVSTGDPNDDAFYNGAVVPAVLEALGDVLGSIKLPALEFEGIHLTTPNALVSDNVLVCQANLAGRPVPPQPLRGHWPPDPFFVLLGPDAVRAAVELTAKHLEGREFSDKGEKGFGIGTGYYEGRVTIRNVRSSGQVSSNLEADVTATINGNGGAGIKFPLNKSIDGHFDIVAHPDPTATVRLSLHGTELSGVVSGLSNFEVKLENHRGDFGDGVLVWAANSLSGYITSKVREGVLGKTFSLYQVPAVHVSTEGVHLEVAPTGLALQKSSSGLLVITGNVAIASVNVTYALA